MKYCIIAITLLFLGNYSYAQKTEKYSRAKINLDRAHTLMGVSALGLAVDHGEHKKNAFFISDFSATEIKKVRAAGYKVDIVIADVKKHYREQNKKKVEEKGN